MANMKMVVIQDDQNDLHGIRVAVAHIDEARADEIIFTDDPSEVVALAASHGDIFVVCDEIQSGETVKELALRVYEVNPEAKLWLYARDARLGMYVDGVIAAKLVSMSDSAADHALLAGLLVSDLLHFNYAEWPSAFPCARIVQERQLPETAPRESEVSS